jgi:hypothetical protein
VRPGLPPACAAGYPAGAAADAALYAQICSIAADDEIRAAERDERRISAKVLIALLVVALVIAARLLFF